MSNKNEDLVLRAAAPDHGPLAATSAGSEAAAIAKAHTSQEKASLARHGEKHAGYHIEMNQVWYSLHGHKTLGWPVYRTCYDGDDERWDTFKLKFRSLLLSAWQKCFPAEEAEERARFIDFPFWEDQARFEGASTAQLREHYKEYLNSSAPFEEQSLPVLTGEARQRFFDRWYVRYQFFLVADAAAIASVFNSPETPPRYLTEATPWINVVQVAWSEVEEKDDDEPDDGYEIVEGTDLFNVGVHRHSVQTLYPGLWTAIQYFDFQYWYERPPEVKWEEA
jgi:hypothetical protein